VLNNKATLALSLIRRDMIMCLSYILVGWLEKYEREALVQKDDF
jgi:hypothetical protein